MQFTDGENFEGHLKFHHLNLLHEDWRYQNCFIQDYWCMKHGSDFIGRLWRESKKPEDPVEAYKRLNKLDQAAFCDEQMEGSTALETKQNIASVSMYLIYILQQARRVHGR